MSRLQTELDAANDEARRWRETHVETARALEALKDDWLNASGAADDYCAEAVKLRAEIATLTKYKDAAILDLSNEYTRRTELEAELARLRSAAPSGDRVREFVAGILHGDEEHRVWLREAGEAFIEGKPLPAPRSRSDGVLAAEEKHKPLRAEIERLREAATHAVTIYDAWSEGAVSNNGLMDIMNNLKDVLASPQPTRHLTNDEVRIFDKALLASSTIIHKGEC